MRKMQLILLCGLVLLLGPFAFAQSITWSAPENVAGTNDVLTGNVVDAYSFGPVGIAATTINGVTFSPFEVWGASSASYGNLTLTSGAALGGAAVGTFSSSSPGTPFANLPADYQSLLGSSAYTNCAFSCTAPLDVTLSGLTAGATYEVEVWVNDSRGGVGPYRTETLSGTTVGTLDFNTAGEGGLGQYILGTFTAGASTESFEITGTNSGNAPFPNTASQINGIEVLTTPEPSTMVLLGLGVLALAFLGKRQSRPALSA